MNKDLVIIDQLKDVSNSICNKLERIVKFRQNKYGHDDMYFYETNTFYNLLKECDFTFFTKNHYKLLLLLNVYNNSPIKKLMYLSDFRLIDGRWYKNKQGTGNAQRYYVGKTPCDGYAMLEEILRQNVKNQYVIEVYDEKNNKMFHLLELIKNSGKSPFNNNCMRSNPNNAWAFYEYLVSKGYIKTYVFQDCDGELLMFTFEWQLDKAKNKEQFKEGQTMLDIMYCYDNFPVKRKVVDIIRNMFDKDGTVFKFRDGVTTGKVIDYCLATSGNGDSHFERLCDDTRLPNPMFDCSDYSKDIGLPYVDCMRYLDENFILYGRRDDRDHKKIDSTSGYSFNNIFGFNSKNNSADCDEWTDDDGDALLRIGHVVVQREQELEVRQDARLEHHYPGVGGALRRPDEARAGGPAVDARRLEPGGGAVA